MAAIANGPVIGSGAGVAADRAATSADEPETPALSLRMLPAVLPAAALTHGGSLEASGLAPLALPDVPAERAELPLVRALPAAMAVLPELLYIVEPDIGPGLLGLLTRPEVAIEFTIRADGSVTGVRVLPPAPRQWVPVVIAAVQQWRFAPLPAPRQHRVQLVFKNGS